MSNKIFRRSAALALSLSLLLSLLAGCGGGLEATAMRLRHTEGTVGVSDGAGKSLKPAEDLGLYGGYQVDTQSASYAWIDLDEVKLTKMDENSDITIQKEGKHLTIEVKSGSLFFDITEPLADDETLDIRTSTMLVGIRGTRGWVQGYESAGWMELYLLEGTVECSSGDTTATVTAGEMASMADGEDIVVVPYPKDLIPDFVLDEVWDEEDAEIIASGRIADTTDWTLSSTGVLRFFGRIDEVQFSQYYPSAIAAEAAGQTGLPENSITINRIAIDTSQMSSMSSMQFAHLDKLRTIAIPDTITSVKTRAFLECTGLTSVTIPKGVTEVENEAFFDCQSLVNVALPSTLKKIGKQSFEGCRSLTGIVLPSGLTEISDMAFYGCRSLTSVFIPRSVTTIGAGAFQYCYDIEIYYEGSERDWQAISVPSPETGNYPFPSEQVPVHFNSRMP